MTDTTHAGTAAAPSTTTSASDVRARLEAVYAVDPAVKDHGITLGEVSEGHVVLHRDVTADMVNSHEICHGGFLFHLADSALAYCVASHGDTPVTRRAEITYVAPARLGTRLTATAKENIEFGRDRVIEVRVTADDELVAYFTGQATSPRR